MHDFKDEQDRLAEDGAEPLAGSGLEGQEADSEFVANAEGETEGGKQ
jgi:hypothetical protein